MKTINILPKASCTGCSACYNVCPVHAIEMKKNDEGFLFPTITESCVNCGACASVCPAITGALHLQNQPVCYAAWAKEPQRQSGSSGGVFPCLAEYIVDNGGVVYGAALEPDCRTLRHIGVSAKDDLRQLYKSKYVQSEPGGVYADVKEKLQGGRPVLFSGCPCQVDALRAYLKKDYDNLYTIDILCHGVPSPLAYNRFLDEISGGKAIKSVDFRDKKYGWGSLISIVFADGSVYYDPHNGNYFRAFLSGLSMREACMHCKYAQPVRVGDITLGDFWGVSDYKKELDDKKGTSLVLANSSKGLKLLDAVSVHMKKMEQVPCNTVVEICKKTNAALVRPTWTPEMRKCFFFHLAKKDTFSKSLRYAEKAIMDIGLLGWWIETPASNYGSTLTNYALYRYLSDEGYSVTFISPPNFDRANAGKFNLDNRYRMTAQYTPEQMTENNKYIDTFIVGSDVLWYYDAFIQSGYLFLLDFVDNCKKKISYSTSFGNTETFFPQSEIPKAKALMQSFDHVAVREFEAVNICRDVFDVDATQVLDPVFLCSHASWEVLAGRAERKPQGKYLFAYMLDPNEESAEQIRQFAQKMGLAVVSITDKQFDQNRKQAALEKCGIIKNATINELVYSMMNAEYVVTDSYHGYCFSLLFRKPFAVLINRIRGASRFETLDELFHVDNRIIENASELLQKPELMEEVDYDRLGPIIEKESERCRTWLKNAISAEKVRRASSDYNMLFREVLSLREIVNDLKARVLKLEKK